VSSIEKFVIQKLRKKLKILYLTIEHEKILDCYDPMQQFLDGYSTGGK